MARVLKHEGRTHRKGTEIVPARAPWVDFPRWMERVEELFEGRPFWPMLRFPEELAMRVPPLDVYEDAGTVVVKAELPGMKREEIDIHVSGDTLTISGRKEKEEKVERKDYLRLERAAGTFTRTVTLPAEVQAEKVTASYRDGILEIRAPRVEGSEARGRKVEVG